MGWLTKTFDASALPFVEPYNDDGDQRSFTLDHTDGRGAQYRRALAAVGFPNPDKGGRTNLVRAVIARRGLGEGILQVFVADQLVGAVPDAAELPARAALAHYGTSAIVVHAYIYRRQGNGTWGTRIYL